MKKQQLLFDIECYKDYFLASFKRVGSEKFAEFELHADCTLDIKAIERIMRTYTIIGFNIISYDLPMIAYALTGADNRALKRLSDELINSKTPHWKICRSLGLSIPSGWDHIDLIDVAPGQASLKIYGGRLHSNRLQDLPIEPSASIKPDQRKGLRLYCRNDLRTTEDLLNSLEKQLQLRVDMGEIYGLDLRSKSDAQIAEAVLRHELELSGVSVGKNTNQPAQFQYTPPKFIRYECETLLHVLRDVLSAQFIVKDNGQVQMPKELSRAIEFNGAKFAMGIGGLHSQEKAQSIVCADDEVLFDADFASYYPFIIIGEQYYPRHLTKSFLTTYESIVNRRIAAKHAGDNVTANSLKITINGSFGKLGSKYSFLYSPELLIQTTVTGQLCLLMLIEMVTSRGGVVVSANTDGVVIKCKKSDHANVQSAMSEFELLSGYTLEETEYKAIHSQSVNNYVAVKPDGKTKGKGCFAVGGIMKNPTAEICALSVQTFLSSGTPIQQTIDACDDIRRFVSVRSVTGGAVWRGEYLGKAVRFYYSTDGDAITYKKNGNKVPKSDGARPMMDLSDGLPPDLDKGWYISEALKMLGSMGC